MNHLAGVMPTRSGHDERLLARGRWSKGGINRRMGFFLEAVAGKRGFQFWDGLDRKWEKAGYGEPALIHCLQMRPGSSTVMSACRSRRLSKVTMSAFSALDTLLDQYDGKNTDLLVRISEDWLPSQKLLRHLVSFAETAEGVAQVVAATWLLKRYQEAGAQFPEPVVVRLLELLSAVDPWKSRLHLLQMLPGLPIPDSCAAQLKKSLMGWMLHRNLFVRSWANSGLHRLASLYPKYRRQIVPLLDRAKNEESASVRARLRQLPELGDTL